MSNKGARNLFIFGSFFFFIIFLAFTFDTLGRLDKRAPEITKEVDEGKKVWHKYDCIGCHTIFGTGSYFAPDMTKVVERKPMGYLKKFVLDPKSVNPNAAMPKLGITSDEADKLIAFLDWISKVDTNGWPPKPILATAAGVGGKELTQGQQIYQAQGCSNCHMINGIGGTTGPELTKVGSRRDRTWFHEHFEAPAKVVPNSAMPSYKHLGDQALEDLTSYMLTLK
jgi:nitric oxide reductase subunit C